MRRAVEPRHAASARERVVPLDGRHDLDRSLIGGKAWSINHLSALGIPTPPAVVITTSAWQGYRAAGLLDEDLWSEILAGLAYLEQAAGRKLGADECPLFVAVRSGAADSMPGMMETILNLGIDELTEAGIARETGDAHFAASIRDRYRAQYRKIVGTESAALDLPTQLRRAVSAIFRSWNSPRARAYRKHHGLDDDAGTAVTIQAMVFGNRDARSGTGVVFSRDPLSGAPGVYGEWLPRAQGEDIVSGTVKPCPLPALAETMPLAHAELVDAARRIERDRRDVQDIEFTIESGRLWLLQTRSAKRSAEAAIRIAVELCGEGVITKHEALARVSPEQARIALRPRLDPSARTQATVLAAGEPACPGLASGIAVADPDAALLRGEQGEPIILIRDTTSPDDVHGMLAARGIVTAIGGSTSHAAVVSRELDRPCVVGCGPGTVARLAGREITVDGGGGRVYAGRLTIEPPDEDSDPWLAKLGAWAAAETPLRVYLPDEAVPAGAQPPDAAVLDGDHAVTSAIERGSAAIRVRQRLPALLAAIRHRHPQTGSPDAQTHAVEGK